MNDLHELASAANQVSPYRRRARARVPAQRNSAPLVLAIVLGSLIIGGAIVYFANRSSSGPARQSTDNAPQTVAEDTQAGEVATQQVRAQVAQFKDFAIRLGQTLGPARKAALQAENPSSTDLVVKYTCSYLVGHLGTRTAPPGKPTEFLAQFSGTAEGVGEGYQSKDTTELNVAFVLGPSGKWRIGSATEQPISHSTSTDFMGVPEKGGPKRDIANIDWLNSAVAAAQKTMAPQ